MRRIGLIGISHEVVMRYCKGINGIAAEERGEGTEANILALSTGYEDYEYSLKKKKWTRIGERLAEIAFQMLPVVAGIALTSDLPSEVADALHKRLNILMEEKGEVYSVPIICADRYVAERCCEEQLSTVALLGTRDVMSENLLVKNLENNGLTVTFVEDDEGIELIEGIIQDLRGGDTVDARNVIDGDAADADVYSYIMGLISGYVETGADGVVLGNPELSLLFDDDVEKGSASSSEIIELDMNNYGLPEVKLFNMERIHINAIAKFCLEKD